MKKMKIKELADILKATLVGNGDIEITGVASLLDATPSDISFFYEKKYYNLLLATKASAVIVPNDFNESLPNKAVLLKIADPNAAFSKVIEIFAPPPIEYKKGCHSTAVIAKTAKVASSCYVGPYVVIDENAEIGENTVICACAYIGQEVKIGKDCLIYPGVVIRERCEIGNKVIIEPNAVLGGDGFGYVPTPFGLAKIPQLGIVKIGDDVEIGANATIDRARFGKTWIKAGCKVDNLVLIGHNVTVGESCLLIGQSGIAGSSRLGQGVILAGQAGISHHLNIGDGVKIAGQAGITKNVPAGDIVAGTPAETRRRFMEREMLPKTVRTLKAKIKELESSVNSLKAKLEELEKNK